MRDVCVVNLFFEASTRTFTSFAIAEQRVGADVVALPPGSSSLGKGETIADTAITLAAMGVRVIVTRHPESGFPYRLAESFEGHVINAGDGRHAHPTQALLDLLTLQTEFGRIAQHDIQRWETPFEVFHQCLRALDREYTVRRDPPM